MYVPRPLDGDPFEGFTLRLFDLTTQTWSIWWSSTRAPGRLEPPVNSFGSSVDVAPLEHCQTYARESHGPHDEDSDAITSREQVPSGEAHH